MTDTDRTRLLVTYGSGLGKLLALERSLNGDKKALTSPWLATVGAIGLVWFTPSLVASVLDVPMQWLAFFGAYAAAVFCAAALRAVSRRREHSSLAERLLIALMVLCGGVPILFVPDWGIFIGLGIALALLGGLEIAGRLAKGEASDNLMPPRVEQWIDCAASADPVTSGPVTPAPEHYEYRRLTVTGSVVRDHTSYWSKRSSFVRLLVAQMSALDGSHPPADTRATPTVAAETGHAWRIRARTALRWGLFAAVVTVVVARADWGLTSAVPWVLDVAPGIEGLPSSGPWRGYAAVAILAGVVLLASAIVYQVVLLPWRAWQALARESVTITSKVAGDDSPASTGRRYQWLAVVAAGLYGAAAIVAVETTLSVAWFDAAQAGENLRIVSVLKGIPLLLVIWLFLLWFGIQLLSRALTSMNVIETNWWPRFPVRTAAEILTVGVGTALLVGLPMLLRTRSLDGSGAELPFDYDPPAAIVLTVCVVIPVVLATIRRRRAAGAVETASPSAAADVRIEPTRSQTQDGGTTAATHRNTSQGLSESTPWVARASPVPAAD